MTFFHTHTHSKFSCLDAMASVPHLVARAAEQGQPALGLTDHGSMSGTIQLYQQAKKHGILPFPGIEGYLVENTEDILTQRYHLGLLALNYDGYQALLKLSSFAHTRKKFHRFPRFDFTDLAKMGEYAGNDVAVLTGCFFGLIPQVFLEQGTEAALRLLEALAKWFPNTFVEIQNHNIVHEFEVPGNIDGIVQGKQTTDAELCDHLVRMAGVVGLPIIITQDAHYLNESDKPAHELMKRMTYGQEKDAEFPGDCFHLADTQWVKRHHQLKHWKMAKASYRQLLEMHKLELPVLDVYKPRIPKAVKNPQTKITAACGQGLAALHRDGKLVADKTVYIQRMNYELDIIKGLKMAGYFSLVHSYVQWCEREGIAVEARGSANGSLVCYLMGITQVDPIQWDLKFERFLSRDRKKPPDIDMDVEDRRRGEIVDWLDKRYRTVHICTYSDLGAREGDGKGNALVTYNSYLRKIYSKEEFVDKFGPQGVLSLRDVVRESKEDYRALKRLTELTPYKSYGVHAAGLLLDGETVKIADYVPTMLVASSGTTVTQFDGDDLEELGLGKLDILGQRTITAMARCQELIGRDNPRDFSWIPWDDPKVCREMSQGRMGTGVFQFEAYSMAKGARRMRIKNTKDCIIAGALFRPACIESGVTEEYLERRWKDVSLRRIPFPHEAFRIATRDTYGLVLFQEQVLDIMRGLGISYEDINRFFAIVKDSGKGSHERNEERAAEVRKRWNVICHRNGITGHDKNRAWAFIEGYTQYGFNKAHAAGYGIRSYRSQYLKTYYPLEFMTAVLETIAGSPREADYVKEARRIGIRIMSADVNSGGINWVMDREKRAIRRGLASVKGVGLAVAERVAGNAPYVSLEDLVQRNSTDRAISGGRAFLNKGEIRGAIKAFKEAGALSSLGYPKG